MLIPPPADLLGSLVAAAEARGRVQMIRETIRLLDGVLDQLDAMLDAEDPDPPPAGPTRPHLVRR